MRLVPDPPGRIAGGSVKLAGVDLLALDDEAMRGVRGKDIAMIFQEPMTSLNPVLTIGSQIAEVLLLHEPISRQQAWDKAIEMLRLARIPEPEQRAQGISASIVRRHAPARHDRHGARLQSEGADRRRADHRARRHHPGADPRHHARPATQARHRDHPDHARSRRGGGDRAARHRDVCRAQGGGGAGRGTVRAPAASLYARADGLDPAAAADARRSGRYRRAPAGNSRHGAGVDRSAGGLRVRAALRACRGSLPRPTIPPTRKSGRAIGRRAGVPPNCSGTAMAERRHAARRRARGARPQEAFPDSHGPVAARRRHRVRRRRRQLHRLPRARRSAWSANPAAANRRSAAPSCG